MKFAIYASRETQVRYFNGVGYVARLERFPRTFGGKPGQVQGSALYVGARRGDDLSVRRYTRPDTPAWYYPGYEA